MNIIKKYRLLMIFIVIMLLLMGSILAATELDTPSHEKTSGKIMISRRCDL